MARFVDPHEWACAACTLHNPPAARACQVCDTPRPAPSSWDLLAAITKELSAIESLVVAATGAPALPSASPAPPGSACEFCGAAVPAANMDIHVARCARAHRDKGGSGGGGGKAGIGPNDGGGGRGGGGGGVLSPKDKQRFDEAITALLIKIDGLENTKGEDAFRTARRAQVKRAEAISAMLSNQPAPGVSGGGSGGGNGSGGAGPGGGGGGDGGGGGGNGGSGWRHGSVDNGGSEGKVAPCEGKGGADEDADAAAAAAADAAVDMDVAGDGGAVEVLAMNDLAALLQLNRAAPQRPDWIPAEMLASPLEAGDEGSSPADLSALPEELRLSSLTLFPFPLPRTLPIGFGAAGGGGGAAGPGSWSTVRVLSLAGNGLEHLPDGFGPGLSGLQVLWLDSNALVSIAPAMFPPSLQEIALHDNAPLASLPDFALCCPRLTTIRLDHCISLGPIMPSFPRSMVSVHLQGCSGISIPDGVLGLLDLPALNDAQLPHDAIHFSDVENPAAVHRSLQLCLLGGQGGGQGGGGAGDVCMGGGDGLDTKGGEGGEGGGTGADSQKEADNADGTGGGDGGAAVGAGGGADNEAMAVQMKEIGNEFFRAQQWDDALRCYKVALEHDGNVGRWGGGAVGRSGGGAVGSPTLQEIG